MIRPLMTALILATASVTSATAQARQVCLNVTMAGADGWGSRTCVPIDRPRGLPVRLAR